MENDMSLVISNALFSDGAAAAVLWNKPQGLSIISSQSLYEPQFRDDIRFIYKDGQLYNQLSVRLPFIVGKSAAEAVNGLLQSQGLKTSDVKYWAVHPGGEYVIDEVKYAIGLSDEQIKPTRDVLANFGNISSPTVWFVLQQLQESGLEPGNYLIMLAFGAGLSAHTMLLRT